MKKSGLIFIFCLLLSNTLGSEVLASTGPYLNLRGGASWVQDADLDYKLPGPFFLSGEAEFDTGFNIGVSAGYDFDTIRLEGEISFIENEFDTLELTAVGFGPPIDGTRKGDVNGDISSANVMLNIFVDLKNDTSVTPYLGAGIGVAEVEVDGSDFENEDDTVFAYQFAAGLGFEISENLVLDIGYRYLATDDPEFDESGLTYEIEYQSHNVSLGFRLIF